MLPLLLSILPQERVASVTGRLDLIEDFTSKVLENKRTIRVSLPFDYEKKPKQRFAVLYMHDGQNLFDGRTSFIPNKEWRVDETTQSLAAAGLIEPLIIVGIDNAGSERIAEYTPTQAELEGKKMGGRGSLYAKFLISELMPEINKRYRTKTGPSNTCLCGSSLGGLVTLQIGLQNPNVFGKLGVVSPSVWWDDRVIVKQVGELSKKPPLRIWADMGTKESPDCVDQIDSLRTALTTKGWKLGGDLAVYVEEGAQHNETAWAGRFGMMLVWLFRKR